MPAGQKYHLLGTGGYVHICTHRWTDNLKHNASGRPIHMIGRSMKTELHVDDSEDDAA